MSAYTKYGGIPPIGVSGANTEFCHTFRGNGITIANCSVTDNVLLDGKRAYFPHVGLFGTVTDGANVSNFNVLNLTINSTKENPGASLGGSGAESSSSPDLGDGKSEYGAVYGYINQSDSTLETDKVSFTSLGVANGRAFRRIDGVFRLYVGGKRYEERHEHGGRLFRRGTCQRQYGYRQFHGDDQYGTYQCG